MFPTQRSFFRFMVILTLLLTLIAPTMSASVRAAPLYTEVGGPIISDTTWTPAGNPYVVTSNIQVMTGVTLTIEPGVVVKFNNAKMMEVDGTLIARGTPDNLVTFTSNQPSPQPGDWGNILFTDASTDATFDSGGNYAGGSVLQYCVVEYGGSNSLDNGVVETKTSSPFIDHCTVRKSSIPPIYAVGTSGVPVVISYNSVSDTFTRCIRVGAGMYVENGVATNNTVNNNLLYCVDDTGYTYSGYGITALAYYGTITVSDNLVVGNSGGINASSYYGQGLVANNIVKSNTITGTAPVSLEGGGMLIHSYGGSMTAMNNVVSGNKARDGGGGIFAYVEYGSVLLTGNMISGNSAAIGGGGIYIPGYSDNVTMTNNIIADNVAYGDGGGVYVRSPTAIISNTIAGNVASGNSSANGGGVYMYYGGELAYNIISANSVSPNGQGEGIYIPGWRYAEVLTNTIVGNFTIFPATASVGGLTIEGTNSYVLQQVHGNTIYGNANYDVVVTGTHDVSGTNNYFGTASYMDINNQIYDWYDDSARGKFLYVPYQQNPDPDAPLAPPLNLKANFQNNTAALSWDPIPSITTGYGYKVYYDNDTSDPPYNGTGATQGNSPIDVGNATSYTLSGLGNSIYYIAVTTYDTHGRESWYSNVVNSQKKVYLPLVLRNP